MCSMIFRLVTLMTLVVGSGWACADDAAHTIKATGTLEGISGGGEMWLRSYFADISEDSDGQMLIEKAVGLVTWPSLKYQFREKQ